ncbi:MAG: aldehyde dehydrogenase family protein [Myxococcales bacterium]|nr:aldehyde dehydrogenase family protein [Myxococcota bacterium]MDW8280242.1 aldehyde dehydrogenase family protein [Myxococcales bacterium]
MRPLRDPVPARGRLSGGRFWPPASVVGELEVRSPADPADLVGVFPFGAEDVEEAVAAAARAARPWGASAVRERVAALSRLRPELQRRAPELVACLARETGRPLWECQREVQGLIGRLDQTLEAAPEQLADRVWPDLPARVASRPLGVVVVIGPAMLPLSTSHTHIVAGLAAGNAVVWKPSPLCPASAQLYAQALHDADLPPGVVNVIFGDDQVGEALATHPRADAVVFTGRAANGARLRRLLLERYDLRLHLHLSAKNAAVVLEDANLELAAYEVATSAFQSAGQRCTATSRVLVHTAVLEEFLALLTAQCLQLRIGPPETEAFMGPLLSAARMEQFIAHRDAARADGAEVIVPGERLDRPGWFVSPSIHLIGQDRRRPDSVYQQQELFGPDLCVYPVRDIDEAFALCDGTDYGLCAALFSDTPLRWKRFTEEIRAGALFWNRGTASPSGLLPFGGEKRSGHGARGGADAVLALRREVSLLGRTSEAVERLPGTQQPQQPRTQLD